MHRTNGLSQFSPPQIISYIPCVTKRLKRGGKQLQIRSHGISYQNLRGLDHTLRPLPHQFSCAYKLCSATSSFPASFIVAKHSSFSESANILSELLVVDFSTTPQSGRIWHHGLQVCSKCSKWLLGPSMYFHGTIETAPKITQHCFLVFF